MNKKHRLWLRKLTGFNQIYRPEPVVIPLEGRVIDAITATGFSWVRVTTPQIDTLDLTAQDVSVIEFADHVEIKRLTGTVCSADNLKLGAATIRSNEIVYKFSRP